MAQSVTVKGLDELIGSLQDVAEDFPRVRREFHEAVTEEIREEVLKSLGSRAKSNTGKVAGWQESVVGTLGGYAAMRPRKGKNGKYAYGYITNALENGHAISRPRNNRKGYRRESKNGTCWGCTSTSVPSLSRKNGQLTAQTVLLIQSNRKWRKKYEL